MRCILQPAKVLGTVPKVNVQAQLRKIFQQVRGLNQNPATVMAVDDIIDVLAEIDRKVELLWVAKSMEERINCTLNQEIPVCCKDEKPTVEPGKVETMRFSAPQAQGLSVKSKPVTVAPTSPKTSLTSKAKTRTAPKAKRSASKAGLVMTKEKKAVSGDV